MRFRLSHGRAIGYRTVGVGPIITLLHPVAFSSRFWGPVAKHLQRDFRLIAPDLPGHGNSDVPDRALSLDEIAADIAELLAVLASEGSVVVGCSMGGMVAQGVALHSPHLVRGLVVSNASHDRDAASREALMQRSAKARAGMPAVHDDSIERWFSPAFRARRPDIVARASAALLAADPIVHVWSWQAMAGLNYGPRLKTLPMPTMALTGSDDRSVTAAVFEALVAALPKARRHVFEGSGHLPPLEMPEDYARVLREFAAPLFATSAAQAKP